MKKILILLFSVSSIVSNAQIPADNLEAYYPFNGNANDESTNSNDGVVSGAALIPDRFGSSASAYQFDGTTDVITIPHSSDLDFDGLTDSYSICCWVKSADPVPIATSGRMIQKRVSSSVYPVSWQVFGPSALSTYAYDGTTVSGGTIGSTVWDGEWHFVVMVVNPDSVSTYLDGAFETSDVNTSVTSTSNSFPITIGNGETGGQGYGGAMDDLRFYSDALTDCEVWAIYMEGITGLDETESVDICEGDDYTFPDGSTQSDITADVTYTSYFPSVLTGCDSASMETTLNVQLVDESASQDGHILNANASGLSYQWVDCDDGFAPIFGETDQEFTATENGNFAVIVTDGDCSDTSECFHVSNVGVAYEMDWIIQLYPNPVSNKLNIDLGRVESGEIQILDTTGKIVLRRSYRQEERIELDMQNLAKGTYFIRIPDQQKVRVYRIIKQ